jgi:DNA-directed RNA polymerase subunit RPC12/RpoP
MEKQKFEVGDYVENRCATCDAERAQIVASVSVENRITGTTCPRCGNKNRFKKSTFEASKFNKDYRQLGKPYRPAEKYEKGDYIQHSSFGFGEVVNVIDSGKIEVLFDDRLRRLVHGHAI